VCNLKKNLFLLEGLYQFSKTVAFNKCSNNVAKSERIIIIHIKYNVKSHHQAFCFLIDVTPSPLANINVTHVIASLDSSWWWPVTLGIAYVALKCVACVI